MDENSNSDFQHPLHAALRIFNAAVRSAFDRVIGASGAFWHPWFSEPEEQEVPAKQGPNTPAEEAPQPMKRSKAKPMPQKATVEKKPEPSTKRSLKEELELEREERTQKTERLRKLRLAKQAAANQKKNHSNNGRGEAPSRSDV